jgi:PhnB protein
MAYMTDNSASIAPSGSQRLVTYFAVNDCAKAVEFYQESLGAELVTRATMLDGTVVHATMRLGDCVFELGEAMPDYGLVAPPAEGNNFTITYWTADVDAVFDKLVASGATVMTPLQDAFSGDRMGVVRCPFGIRWCVARHDRDVPVEEIEAAARAWAAAQED